MTWVQLENYSKAKQLKVILVGAIIAICFTLVACSSTRFKGFHISGSDTLVVVKNTEIFKTCIPLDGEDTTKEYFVGVRCDFKGKAPDKIEFVYTIWASSEMSKIDFFGSLLKDSNLPQVVKDKYRNSEETMYVTTDGRIVERDEWISIGQAKRETVIKQLPESAWQTYTIHVDDVLKKYEGKTPKGRPAGIALPIGALGMHIDSPFTQIHDKELRLYILFDSKGNADVEEQFRWENQLPSNPYA